MPLVTVIVPVFNGQDYLEACLKSIVQQTYKHLEVLVVDDGSTDQTRDIAAGFACRDCRVTVIGISNSGVSVARNTGVRRASGEYIVFVDSDDLLHPGSISHLVTIGEKSECGVVLHMPTGVASTSVDFPSISRRAQVRMLTGEQACQNMLYQQGIPGAPWAKLIRRSVLADTRFPEGIRYAEDVLFSFSVLASSKMVAISDFCGYGYRQHPSSVLASSFSPARADGLTACEIIMKEAAAVSPRAVAAARSRLLVEAVFVLAAIDRSGRDWPQEARRSDEVIKRHRADVLRDPSAFGGIAWRFALGSFVPRRFVVRLVHMRRKLKEFTRSGSGT